MTLASDVQADMGARRDNRGLRILCPNGHLGFAPTKVGSFARGLAAEPDMIACDSGSCDCGPIPLGADSSASPLAWQRHDIEAMLVGARRLGVPMLIGSAGDTGTNSRVDRFVGIVRELAQEHQLPPFKLGYFYSEVAKDAVRRRIAAGEKVHGLDGRPDLSLTELDATDRIVAVAGIHPYIKLLDLGADVIIGGRSSDCAIFAAPAIRRGYPEALAYYYGKIMECASFCAEPYGAKESVMGEITMEDVKVTAMLPEQRCTVASVAAHAMYERSNPYYEYFLGGHIDMRGCVYEQFDDRTTRVTGPCYVAADELRVKLEGAGKVGERCVGIVGIRDPYTISRIDDVIAWARNAVRERFGNAGYELAYTVYGRDGVMGELEPLRQRPAHELCVVVQGVAPTKEMAEEVCIAGSRQMFYARLPDVKGTAGGVAFLLDEVMPASPAYRWTLNHTMRVDDPCDLFPVNLTVAGA
ncbi:MAG TPA: acyclic terpene utilization AtuA family protein [Xanthobacteraceae bacterium]|nr:acyclic terpene utilization AtuA family protein [Xanthobacteraceae bacterium]